MVETWRFDPAGGRFSSTAAMDEHLIHEWNRTVPPNGIVFHLGDVCFQNRVDMWATLSVLHGEIHLIRGNHDRQVIQQYPERFASIHEYLELSIRDGEVRAEHPTQKVVLCHYAFRTWNRAHFQAWNIHGHSHGNLPRIGGQLDVGVDDKRITTEYRPLAYAEIAAHLATKPYIPVDHHEGRVKDVDLQRQDAKDREQFG